MQDKASGFAHLLNTLFLVVPVVSTTFASVSTFLKYIDKNELGTLIIDEAGQATPYSALGALWRTGKAIIKWNILDQSIYLILLIFEDGRLPDVYLIPSGCCMAVSQ